LSDFNWEMAARAGIEPGQAIWRSSAISAPVNGWESQELHRKLYAITHSGELFISYAPEGCDVLGWRDGGRMD
jgi:hypothetical protein